MINILSNKKTIISTLKANAPGSFCIALSKGVEISWKQSTLGKNVSIELFRLREEFILILTAAIYFED